MGGAGARGYAVRRRCRGRDTVGMNRRRAILVLEAGLSAVAVALFLAVMMGSSHRAGAAVGKSTTTSGCVVCPPPTTVPTTTSPPTTRPPATTAAPTTTPATTAPSKTAPATRPTHITTPTTAGTTTTVAPIPGIGGHLPVSASTLPFTTKQQSAHVNPVFAALSGAGFVVALVIIGVRFLLTRPGRR